jgi:mRNA interferase RelE/StbE
VPILKLTDTAIESLKKFNHAEQQLIAKKLRYLAENFEALKSGKKVTELKGTDYKHYRFVIARRIRAIFEIQDEKLVLLVLRIGRRKDVYS